MTALAEVHVRGATVGLPRRSIRVYEEHYPEMCKKAHRFHFEEKFKILGDLVEDVAEVDEEPSGLTDCSSSSSLNLEGRSPYALPIEDRLCYHMPRCQTSLIAHPRQGPKFPRRSANSRARLEHGFSESVHRRKRCSVLHGERRNGGHLEHLAMDFLHLPPIPETVPLQLCDEKTSKFE